MRRPGAWPGQPLAPAPPVPVRIRRPWPPAGVRTGRFWLAVAPAALVVFGSVSLAIVVVVPEEVTSARSLSAGFAGLMTALSFTAGVAAVLLGLAYALCLVSGLRQAEHMASPDERGAVIACYYTVAYLGFAVPYLVDGLGAVSGLVGAFGLLTAIIAVLALWTTGYAIRSSLASPPTPESESARGEGRPVPQ
jgi:hypothetical protein